MAISIISNRPRIILSELFMLRVQVELVHFCSAALVCSLSAVTADDVKSFASFVFVALKLSVRALPQS